MRKLCWIVGASIGGAIGWWIGGKVGIMTAYILSSAGALLGVYLGIKFSREYFE
jgi:uncharacterized protein YcfJ